MDFSIGISKTLGVALGGVTSCLLSPPPRPVWLCDINTLQSVREGATSELPFVSWSHMKKISTKCYNLFSPAAVPKGLSDLKLVNEKGLTHCTV